MRPGIRAPGPTGSTTALDRLARDAVAAARGETALLLLTDAAWSIDRLPIPSILATGAVHTALTSAGLRGRTDIAVSAVDILDVHAMAMVLAVGATAVHPRLAIELAGELAGSRGAEDLSPTDTIGHLIAAFEAGLRKTLARMGISAVASYIGGALIDVVDLDASVVARCFPTAAAWPGRTTLADLADAGYPPSSRRAGHPRTRRRPRGTAAGPRFRALPGRRRGSPLLPEDRRRDHSCCRWAAWGRPGVTGADGATAPTIDEALTRYRTALSRPAGARAVPRDELRIRAASVATPLVEVEDARSIVRRFVVSAMSVGALSPEAHQALTIGIQRAGGAANTGEGGEDPAWYAPGPDGRRHDARIKQVASARFGVTAAYLARADQLEIKIAQGSKPGEGGQLPGRKATAYIAALRRGQPGRATSARRRTTTSTRSRTSPSSSPTCARSTRPRASASSSSPAAGSGRSRRAWPRPAPRTSTCPGTPAGPGASPLRSIKHVGAPWELGLAEVHQVLLRNDLRDRVVLRTDGGLQTGRDLIVAALLGAEEFAFGTAALVAIGCDMARQCHLDTCPTGIATQREDLRAKFAGTPDDVVRFFTAIAEDVRRELAAVGARSVGEIVGESRRLLHATPAARADLAPVIGAAPWPATAARRADPARRGPRVAHAPGLVARSSASPPRSAARGPSPRPGSA